MLCKSCGIDKPQVCFQKHRRQCKDCRSSYTKMWLRNNTSKTAEYNKRSATIGWKARNKDRVLELARQSAKRAGYRHQKNWKAANPLKVNSYTRKRQAAHATCNRRKSTKPEPDWDPVLEEFV